MMQLGEKERDGGRGGAIIALKVEKLWEDQRERSICSPGLMEKPAAGSAEH